MGGSHTKLTYFFNFDDQKWTPGPSMMYAVTFHGCALLKSHGRSIIVVAGGLSDHVQFLDLQNTIEWFNGKQHYYFIRQHFYQFGCGISKMVGPKKHEFCIKVT